MSINRGMDKDVMHIYNEILIKKAIKRYNAICTNTDGPTDYHSK